MPAWFRGSIRLLAFSMLALGACGDDDGPRVPIREGVAEDDVPPPQPTEELAVSRELQGQPAVHVEGAPVELPGTALHAILTKDLDGDEDRDALVLGFSEEGEVNLGLARRQGNAFATRRLASVDPATVLAAESPVCAVDRATITFLSAAWAHAEATLRCSEAEDEAQTEPGEDATPVTGHFFIEVGGGTPRVKERFLVARGLVLEPFLEDLDEDGHQDFRLHLTGPRELAIDLPLKDRAAGLILDPEPALLVLGGELDAAEEAIANDPTSAAERAGRLVQWSQLLCRDFDPQSPEALRIGDEGGLRCPQKARAGQLDLVARLRSGDFLGAIELVDRMPAADRRSALTSEAVRAALAPARASDLETREILARASGDLVFRDDATLAVLDEPPVRVLLADGARRPDPGVPAIIDPTGHHSARLGRRCSGLQLEVTDAFRPGPVQAEALVVDDPAPEPCTGSPEDPSHPWRILGWAPQGLIIAAPGKRRVVPIVAGPRIEASEELGLTTPPPAPLRGPRITPDGSIWIVETPLGVMRYEGARMKLWWPEGWELGERADAVALSPDGTRIAIRRADGRTVVLEQKGDGP